MVRAESNRHAIAGRLLPMSERPATMPPPRGAPIHLRGRTAPPSLQENQYIVGVNQGVQFQTGLFPRAV